MSDQISFLRDLLLTEIDSLEEAMEVVHLAPGELLFSRGDQGDAFYIIQEGQVRVFTNDEEGRELTLNTIGPGETFGEIALLDSRPRSASISAVTAVTLHRLNREGFLDRVHGSPALTQAVMRLLGERVRGLTDYIERLGHWARLVAEGEYDQALQNIQDIKDSDDRTLAAVADAVKSMVQAVREREERLRREAVQLRIQIDESKRKKQVDRITESEYFHDLLQESQRLRRRKQ